MKKTKPKRVPPKKFLFLSGARKNTLLNFRNNVQVKGCYLTLRFGYPPPFPYGHKKEESIALPVRHKRKFEVGDVVLLNQRVRFDYVKSFKPVDCRKKEKLYFKILLVEEQEIWDGVRGPYYIAFLGIKKLNNLEFLSAMNDLKTRQKERRKK